jgi:hypothetical protein
MRGYYNKILPDSSILAINILLFLQFCIFLILNAHDEKN